MIFILSDENDLSTNHIIDWLSYYNEKFIRINRGDKIKISWIDLQKPDFEIIVNNKQVIRYSDVKSFWYRRGYLNVKQIELSSSIKSLDYFKELISYFNDEVEDMKFYIFKMFEKKNSIGSIYHNDINKLWVLHQASEIGLNVPITNIVTSKDQLDNFKSELITKAIRNGFYADRREYFYTSYTEEVKHNLHVNSKWFFPSLIQNKIEKWFELRIFFLEQTFYTEAIFSQNDKQTTIDFRKYNYSKQNRTVRYELPKIVEKKLSILMEKIGLNSGSIDMIYTKDNEYIFLEVNPVGQFLQVSRPCNYNIEYLIAKKLMNYDANKTTSWSEVYN